MNSMRAGVKFTLLAGAYDRSRPLVIDPSLVYSAIIQDTGVVGMAVEGAGNLYVAGSGFLQSATGTPGAYQTNCLNNSGCVSVVKLNPTGTSVLYRTYIGRTRNGFRNDGRCCGQCLSDGLCPGAVSVDLWRVRAADEQWWRVCHQAVAGRRCVGLFDGDLLHGDLRRPDENCRHCRGLCGAGVCDWR